MNAYHSDWASERVSAVRRISVGWAMHCKRTV